MEQAVRSEIPKSILEVLQRGLEQSVFPGAVLVVGKDSRKVAHYSVGTKFLGGEVDLESNVMEPDTVFDVAAITGVAVTSTILMHYVENGLLKLDEPISRYIGGFSVHGKSRITVGQVLSHYSGLPAWQSYFDELVRENAGTRMGILTSRGALDYVYNVIKRSNLKHSPGAKQLYSDVGLILLGHLVETLSGKTLEKAARTMVFGPLGMKSSSFIDLSLIRRRGIHPVTSMIAPTESCPWRKRVLCGEVHDDNAWAMGGVSGHSGLFCTAEDLHLYGSAMLGAYKGRGSYLKSETLKKFWSSPVSKGDSKWCYGWDSPSKENGLLESKLSSGAIGCNGFTGCSIWLEPEKNLSVVLMTNRIHPSRSNKKIRGYRVELHNAVLEEYGS